MNKEFLLSLIEKAKKGISVEGSNLDLKWQWWDMISELDEFLKDICSMANAPFGDSYIIIGLKENGAVGDAPLPENEANIQSKHKDKIEPRISIKIDEFVIEGRTISVVTIPHSQNRPHVIKRWRNRDSWIPVRAGSAVLTASRSDLDEMCRERLGDGVPSLSVELAEKTIKWDNYAEYGGPSFLVRLNIDNYEGGVPDYITKVRLVETSGDYWESKHFKFGELGLDQELKIDARDRKSNIPVYLSDSPPEGFRNPRRRPDVDRDTMVLEISTRSSKTIKLKIRTGWIQ